MKFSIIICTYNVVNKLPKTLDSILLQNCQDYEVIIIDGASTDGTLSVINDYIDKFSGRLRYISENDTGIYNAMNKGVRIADGQYLLVVGAGDWIEEEALSAAKKCAEEFPDTGAIYGKTRVWSKNLETQQIVQTDSSILPTQPMQHPSMFYKKDLHERFGYYDESYKIAADYAFCLKVFYFGKVNTKPFDAVVDNFVMDGISSTNQEECELETTRARKECGVLNVGILNSILYYIKNKIKI